MVPGIRPIRMGTRRTMPRTVKIAPAVCRIRPPMDSENRPSTVRYKMAPMTAWATPGPLSEMGTWLCRIVVVMKNTANTVMALSTKAREAHTVAFAASIGIRRGTASNDERIAPVVYSLLMTSTPSTQIANWPRPRPAPKRTEVGLDSSLAWPEWLPGLFHVLLMTAAIRVLKPIATITKAAIDQIVDWTERIFVHSARSRPMLMPSPACRTRRYPRSVP